jgi:predicted DNA-binding protein YlxM (UPF0122 family)
MNPIDRIAAECEALLRTYECRLSIISKLSVEGRLADKLREAIAEGVRLQKLVDELSQEKVK